MPITTITHNDNSSPKVLPDWLIEILQKVFLLGLIVTVALLGYLFYGLFSGQLANAAGDSTSQQHVMSLIGSVAFYLNVSLLVTLITAVVLFYDNETAALVMLLVAAFLAYGLKFCLDYFSSDSTRFTNGKFAEMTLSVIQSAGVMIAVPGILLFLRNIVARIIEGRRGPDLANMQYGKHIAKQDVPRALLGAAAKCWQLPYCREGIRVKCPIFHARTKCWKERVGCMCEENIIRLAMGGEEHKPTDLTKESGFVPIGDLIIKSEAESRPNLPTRKGARGVRIPTNPHLSEAQKRERCRNCIIYNEHQRQKYNLLSPIITILVPALVFTQFDSLKAWLNSTLRDLDALIAHLQFTHTQIPGTPGIGQDFSNSMFIEGFLIVCITLLIMTWALRLLEYCTFKIKI